MTAAPSAPSRPLLRYYGGKWRVADQIVARFPRHTVYVEPFGGGASVLFRKPRSTCEIYNDLEDGVVNLFRVLRDQPAELVAAIELTPYSRAEFVSASLTKHEGSAVERARKFIFVVAASYGSGSVRAGFSTAPRKDFRASLCDNAYGNSVSWKNLPGVLPELVERLRGVTIESGEAMPLMARFDAARTLHYVDPPYLGKTRKDDKNGYKHEMRTEAQHAELLTFLKSLAGMVAVSGYPCALYDTALADWRRIEMKSRDQTNAQRIEVLWMNYPQESLPLFRDANSPD